MALRFALLNVKGRGTSVPAYLPEAYEACGYDREGNLLIQGDDVAGWTLDGYVLPRLASGLYFGSEITADEAWEIEIVAHLDGSPTEPRGRVQ